MKIDCHCHILPGIDDGTADFFENHVFSNRYKLFIFAPQSASYNVLADNPYSHNNRAMAQTLAGVNYALAAGPGIRRCSLFYCCVIWKTNPNVMLL